MRSRIAVVLSLLVFCVIPGVLSLGKVLLQTPRDDTYSFAHNQAAIGGLLPDNGLRAPLSIGIPYNGCDCLDTAAVAGSVVLLTRGDCDFVTKMRHAQGSGALGVIVADDADGSLVTIDAHGLIVDLSIPGVSVSKKAGNLMLAIQQSLPNRVGEAWVCTVTLLPDQIEGSWPTFVLPFAVVVIVMLILIIFYILYRRRSRFRPMGTLTQKDLNLLPIRQFGVKPHVWSVDTCAICLEDYLPESNVRTLPCQHEFHVCCIDRWLLTGRRCCPICKQEVLPTETSCLLPRCTSTHTTPTPLSGPAHLTPSLPDPFHLSPALPGSSVLSTSLTCPSMVTPQADTSTPTAPPLDAVAVTIVGPEASEDV